MKRMNWDLLLSKQRQGTSFHDETNFDARTEFQRDIDRIVFSSAFRRLQDKTQVMPMPKNDYVRSRLTHSIEVSSIGRSLGKLVGNFVIKQEKLDRNKFTTEDFGVVTAAACLTHDIGNPPFGHTGERAIGKFFENLFTKEPEIAKLLTFEERSDLTEFEGNAAGFRILSNDHPTGRTGGHRLTFATLGAFTKYPKGSIATKFNKLGALSKDRKSQTKYGFFQEEKRVFTEVANGLGLIRLSNAKNNPSYCRHPLSFLMEAADSLTYTVIDFEDGHKLGYISHAIAEDLLYSILKRTKDPRCNTEDWKMIHDKDERVGALRAKALNSLLYECLLLFQENYEDIMHGIFDKELPDHIPSSDDLKKIKKISKENFYNHSSVIDVELAGFDVLGGLLEMFTGIVFEIHHTKEVKDDRNKRLLLKMSDQFQIQLKDPKISTYKKLLVCADFVSRMTDGHALKLYKKLKGVEL